MRLAIVIALAANRRSAIALTNVLPADQAVAKVKQAIVEKAMPDARYPVIAAIALDSTLREHRFRPTDKEIADALEAAGAVVVTGDDELNALIASNGSLQSQVETALKEIARLAKDNTGLAADGGKFLQELEAAKAQITALKADLTKAAEKQSVSDGEVAALKAELAKATEKTTTAQGTGKPKDDKPPK